MIKKSKRVRLRYIVIARPLTRVERADLFALLAYRYNAMTLATIHIRHRVKHPLVVTVARYYAHIVKNLLNAMGVQTTSIRHTL